MRGLSKSEKVLLAILLVMVVGYIYYQYIISPTFNKIQKTQSSIELYKTELNEHKVLKEENKKLSEELVSLQAKFHEYTAAIPRSEREPEVLYDLQKLWEDKSLNISTIAIGAGTPYNDTGLEEVSEVKAMVLPVAMSFSGDYDDIMNFIRELEERSRITNVNSINFALGTTDDEDTVVNVSINAQMLYIEDGSAIEKQFDFNNGSYGKDNPFR